MTKLLDQAIAKACELPEPEQEAIALMVLEKIRPESFFFLNIGQGDRSVRTWDDNVKYGYVGAGQGVWYRDGLQRLEPGDKVFAYITGVGYVGYGIVLSHACMIKDFVVESLNQKLLDCPIPRKAAEFCDDPTMAEYAVSIKWIKVFPESESRFFAGASAYRHISCQLNDQRTLDYLRQEFGIFAQR